MKIFGIERVHDEDKKLLLANPTRKFYLSIGGNIYAFCLEIGRLGISWDAKNEMIK
jgi:hypothetical protein